MAVWDYLFNPAQQGSSSSYFFFFPKWLHLSPWVYIHQILSTSRTWGFLQVKIVATNLNAAEEALEAYQREKQQRLNELLVVIPLKLHQVMGLEVAPPSLSRKSITLRLFQRKIHGTLVGRRAVLVWDVYLQNDTPTFLTPSEIVIKT